MIRFKKDYNLRIVSLIISIIFLCNTSLYSYPVSRDTLRVPVAQLQTYNRITEVIRTYEEQEGRIDPNIRSAHEDGRAHHLHEKRPDVIEEVHEFLRANGLGEAVGLFEELQEHAAIEIPGWDRGGLWLVEPIPGEELPREHASDAGGIHIVNFPGEDIAKAYVHGMAAYIGFPHEISEHFEQAFIEWRRTKKPLGDALKDRFITGIELRSEHSNLLTQLSEKEKEGIYLRDYTLPKDDLAGLRKQREEQRYLIVEEKAKSVKRLIEEAGYTVKSVLFHGSFLESENPTDLDIVVVVEGRTEATSNWKFDLSALYPVLPGEENPIKIDLVLVGEEWLRSSPHPQAELLRTAVKLDKQTIIGHSYEGELPIPTPFQILGLALEFNRNAEDFLYEDLNISKARRRLLQAARLLVQILPDAGVNPNEVELLSAEQLNDYQDKQLSLISAERRRIRAELGMSPLEVVEDKPFPVVPEHVALGAKVIAIDWGGTLTPADNSTVVPLDDFLMNSLLAIELLLLADDELTIHIISGGKVQDNINQILELSPRFVLLRGERFHVHEQVADKNQKVKDILRQNGTTENSVIAIGNNDTDSSMALSDGYFVKVVPHTRSLGLTALDILGHILDVKGDAHFNRTDSISSTESVIVGESENHEEIGDWLRAHAELRGLPVVSFDFHADFHMWNGLRMQGLIKKAIWASLGILNKKLEFHSIGDEKIDEMTLSGEEEWPELPKRTVLSFDLDFFGQGTEYNLTLDEIIEVVDRIANELERQGVEVVGIHFAHERHYTKRKGTESREIVDIIRERFGLPYPLIGQEEVIGSTLEVEGDICTTIEQERLSNIVKVNTVVTETTEAAEWRAARRIADLIKSKNARGEKTVLGLATGGTYEGIYAKLIEITRTENITWMNVVTFNLDEYVWQAHGYPEEYRRQYYEKESYRDYMYNNLFTWMIENAGLREGNIHLMDGFANSPELEARLYEEAIMRETNGEGVDLQVLGIGVEGHIAFIEARADMPLEEFLQIKTKEEELAPSTIEANSRYFGNNIEAVPTHAMTQGIATILGAKELLLVGTGSKKIEAITNTVAEPVTPAVPASVLQLHEKATVIVDKDAAQGVIEIAESSRRQHVDSMDKIIAVPASKIIDNESTFMNWLSKQPENVAVEIIAIGRDEYDKIVKFNNVAWLKIVPMENDNLEGIYPIEIMDVGLDDVDRAFAIFEDTDLFMGFNAGKLDIDRDKALIEALASGV